MGTHKEVKRSKGWAAAEKKYYRDRALLLKLFRASTSKTESLSEQRKSEQRGLL